VRFVLRQRFPVPVEVVEDALADPSFFEHAGAFTELGSPRLLELRVEGAIVHRRLRYRFVGELSPAVTSVVDPARLTWVEESAHDRRTHAGQHRILPDHYGERLRCRFTTRLQPEGGGTERVADGDLRVRFPLVGGKVERAIVSGLVHHAEVEEAVLAGWLQERG
jgi:hypothetical protein